MKTPRHTVASALAQRTLQPGANSKQLAHEIAAYMLAERRTGELDSLLRDMMQDRANAGIVEVTAVSAFPLSDSVRRDVEVQVRQEFPAARQVIISHQHDDTVIGGIRLEFANQQLDLSIRSKLNRLKQLTAN